MKNVRLSKHIIPTKYDIELRPDLQNFTFEGLETVSINLLQPTKSITLHCKEIEVETAEIKIAKEKTFAKISYNEKAETVTLTFPQVLPKGKSKLTLVFKGILNDKMRGFYKSSYEFQGKTHHLATTQFEATDARRAFPCFDEPAHKAVFHVSLVVPKGKTAISNTLPVSVKEHAAGFDIVHFAPTPKMSTYLLAFIVGDFEYIESRTLKGVQVRVFTTPGKKHQAGFALDCAVKTIEFFEEYFDIPYPLPVLDMIAIPDFASGAMENWGAVTYRETALLVDPKHTSASNKQWVALVVAHELAHQWFGNLVTMEWWTHLWLNEGFASYIEYLAVDKLFPEWDIWTQFSVNDLGVALRLDALHHTHPIEVEVHHPDEIGEIFDEVSYSKGASVIRMLADYLGEKDFRDGLRYYLKKHSFKNTETIHLWKAFEKISKKPVSRMMHNWTSRGGYPVISAEIKNGSLQFKQKRFFSSAISARKSKDKTIWSVPITTYSNGEMQKHFLSRLSQTVESRMSNFSAEKYATAKKRVSNEAWTKVNYGEAGFFRTAYSEELLSLLEEPVRNKTLSARDRLGIVRDLFALAEAQVIPTIFPLGFLDAYKTETDFTVWVELASGLGRLEQIFAKTPAKDDLNKFIINLFSAPFARLGWEKTNKDSHTDAMLRSLVISRLGRSGDKKIIAQAKKYWRDIKTDKHVNPDIRGAIYATIASHGGRTEYNALLKKYKTETMHEEKNRVGASLGYFKDPAILQEVCEFALSPAVRTQDTMGLFASVGANPVGRDIWLRFVIKNWKTLVARYGDGGHQLARLVKAISGSAEEKHFKAYKNFFTTHETPGATRAVDQVLEVLENNISWLKKDKKAIELFLRK